MFSAQRASSLSTLQCLAVIFVVFLASTALAQVPRGIYVYSWNVPENTPPPAPCTSSSSGCPTSLPQQLVDSLAVQGVDGLTLVIDWSAIEPRQGVFQWDPAELTPYDPTVTYVRGDAVSSGKYNYISLSNDNVNNQPQPCAGTCQYWQFIGTAQPNLLDQWITAAVSQPADTANPRRSINLAIRAGGGDSGWATPCWIFGGQECGAGYSDATGTLTMLDFDVSAHQGAGKCIEVHIAAPWHDQYLQAWDAMLKAVVAHLKSTATPLGTSEWDSISMVRLTGMNRTTDEFRLPEELLTTTQLQNDNCPTPYPAQNAIETWIGAQYDKSKVDSAWGKIVDLFQTNFADKYFNLPIIPDGTGTGGAPGANGTKQYPFPEIGPNECVYDPPVDIAEVPGASKCSTKMPDLNRQPLQTFSSSQQFPGQLALEFESLVGGRSANTYVVNHSPQLNVSAAFMTNVFLGKDGAACSGGPGTAQPCTSGADYFNLLQEGIFLSPATYSKYRSQFVEVYAPNVLKFNCAIWQAHTDLTDYTPPVTTVAVSGTAGKNQWYTGPVKLTFGATDASTTGNTACPLPAPVTEFSSDAGTTWTTGSSDLLSADGVYTILYRSTDIAGNVETPNLTSIQIDATPPSIHASFSVIYDPMTRTVLVSGTGAILDAISGVDFSTAQFRVFDSHKVLVTGGPLTWSKGAYSFRTALPGNKAYTVVVSAADNAGNAASQSKFVPRF